MDLGTISDNMAKNHYFMPVFTFFGQAPLGNNVAMATSNIPGDQKLFERVCYI